MRLQPWFWQGVLTFGAFTLLARRPARAPDVLAALRLLVAATYLWSGLFKSHGAFARDGWPWLVDPLAQHLSGGLKEALLAGGWLAGPLEAGQGLLLAFGGPRGRRLGVALACGMHLFILAMVGPWGHAWNVVVWPWNLTMVGLLLVLFAGARETRLPRRPRGMLGVAAALLLGVLPASHLLGIWDAYLSFSLYSYEAPSATFVLGEPVRDALPPEVAAEVTTDGEGRLQLDADHWALATVGVPVYPERRVFHRAHAWLCELGTGPDAAHLVLRTPRPWRSGAIFELFRCGDAQPFVRRLVR
jgi:hypothetical protein